MVSVGAEEGPEVGCDEALRFKAPVPRVRGDGGGDGVDRIGSLTRTRLPGPTAVEGSARLRLGGAGASSASSANAFFDFLGFGRRLRTSVTLRVHDTLLCTHDKHRTLVLSLSKQQ